LARKKKPILDPFDTTNWNSEKRELLEKDVQKPSVDKARRHDWWARKFSSQPGNTSVPDYIFGKYGCIFFVEFKRPGGVPTELQEDEHMVMRKHGLIVYVCDTRKLFDKILARENERAEQFAWLYA
jgi:hypothetical protein